MINKFFYHIKPYIPRKTQIFLRKRLIGYKLNKYRHIWPIDPESNKLPEHWRGWPQEKQFALVLTHDVETAQGVDKCRQVAEMEERLGFRSSFNFVPGDYRVPEDLRRYLTDHGFEIGVHGLHHDKNPFRTRAVFQNQSIQINRYLREWGGVGFRSPSMYHDLDMIHDLNIEYDASTFDTDPFEPQPDGMRTIFPFWVPGTNGQRGYVELPYTLPQDFLLFVLMREKNIDIWKTKLGWIAENNGMAMVIVHPDYMSFDKAIGNEEYPAAYYEQFLEYIRTSHDGLFWNGLPKDIGRFWQSQYQNSLIGRSSKKKKKRACMLYYMKFKGSAILYREAKALREKGFDVDIICLRESKDEKVYQSYDGLNLFLIQSRPASEQKTTLYFMRLLFFCLKSFFILSYFGLKKRYDIVHVTSPPDIIIFSALVPKLLGAGVILDIHDIGPELYMRKLGVAEKNTIIGILKYLERVSSRFADHVITVTDIWRDKLLKRVNHGIKCTTIINVPDEEMFKPLSARKPHPGNSCNLFYHGSFEEHFGVDTLIKAIQIVRKQIPQVTLDLYGGGRLYESMIDLSIELGIDDCVHFNGGVPFYELPEILKKADIGVVPTKAAVFSNEALSMKSLEYLTLGIPIVISRTAAHSYYYDDRMVVFFAPEDENDLATAITTLYRKSGAERNELIDSAMKFLEKQNWSHAKEIYYKIVESLIDRQNA
jgi:glycosyltransferase involved in cell wall biosynthesis/peptidoglycan/xylan/chitin deacetylase (PgdA/CDA1 family)